MVIREKYVVIKHFCGLPKRSDFIIVEEELPLLKDGEILLKTKYISVDAYARFTNTNRELPYDQYGFQIGQVIETRNKEYPVGCHVVSHAGWCTYSIVTPGLPPSKEFLDTAYKLPDLQGLPTSYGLSVIFLMGTCAYNGLIKLCDPKLGETLVVTSAAGAIGTLVGQIGKIKGCKVIGFTGSDHKVDILQNELGFDKAYNYKTVDVAKALDEAAPEGVDCFYDNVGGEISTIIINKMNRFGRVSVCGSSCSYNDPIGSKRQAGIIQPAVVFNELRIEGFLSLRWLDRWMEPFSILLEWIHGGKLIVKEHITEGFENVYDAFLGLLCGENVGKAIVKIY